MAGNLLPLLKVEMIRQVGLLSALHEKDSKKKYRAMGISALMIFVGIVMGGYCFVISYGLGAVGISQVVPSYALTISSLVILVFTFFKTNGVLFASKDYDMLMALPIKVETVVTAKFFSMYLSNMLFSAIVMIPMAAGYWCWNEMIFSSIVSWIVGMVFTPLFPMTLAAIFGMLIAKIGSGFRHSALAQVIILLLLTVAFFVGSFWVNGQAVKDEAAFLEMITNNGVMISDMLHKMYPLSVWFDYAVKQGSWLYLFTFIIFSIIVYGAFVVICGKSYRKINSALNSHYAATNYQVAELKSSSVMIALVKKEAKRFLSSSLYMMNVGIGLILALLVAIASIFVGVDHLINGLNIANTDVIQMSLSVWMPFGIALIVNMCNTCSVSLSLEGKHLWIMQSFPIDKKILLKSKMLFNIVLVFPISFICSIIFILELHIGIGMAVIYLLFSIVSTLFSSSLGTWCNVKFPNYKWQNEVEVIKQGLALGISMFGSMASYVLLAIGVYFLKQMVPAELALLFSCVVLGIAGAVLYRSCYKGGNSFYEGC